MNINFENNLFIGTLIVYFIMNMANTGLMITRKKVGLKLIFALLPFALVMLTMFVSLEILKSAVNFDNLPFGTDYGGYATGLVIILGLIMMFFYTVNAIYLIVIAIKNNISSER
ncbi:hypothetical protein [Clostridium sp.]|uniref:hypothetical protein n=1 Tax=Clostridium sp. TaxID=1506 RepID=UPI003D6CFA61